MAGTPLETIALEDYENRLRAEILGSQATHTNLVDELVERANSRREFPSTRPDELRPSIGRALELLLTSLCGRDDLETSEPWRALGGHRARRGDNEDVVVGDLDDIAAAVWQSVLSRAGMLEASGAVAIGATGRLRKTFEDIILQARFEILAGYRSASDRAARDRPPAAFVDRLLSGAFASDRDIRDAAAEVAHSMVSPQLLVVVFAGPTAVDLEDAAGAMADAFGGIHGPVRSDPLEHSAVLAAWPTGDTFEKPTRRADKVAADLGLLVVVIGPLDQPIRFAAEYRRLLQDSSVVEMATSVPGAVGWSDFEHHRLLSRAPMAERFAFALQVLGRLLRHKRSETLLATLDAYFETDEGREGAARRLGVTSRTVRSRMKTISGLLDESLHHPREAARVFTAIRLARTLSVELTHTLATATGGGDQRGADS